MQKLLLLSNSTMPGTPFFTWPQPWVRKFLGERRKKLIFIPYAAVTISFDEYESKVKEVLHHDVQSIHHFEDPKKAVQEAEGIVVGGGNTFALLSRIYHHDLLTVIREKVRSGTPYIGWSAGANLSCPTLMTTNDMPIVQPPSFEALNLIPIQLNPHYHELRFEGQGGETRVERLTEFLAMNANRKVLGLPEGMLLSVEDHQAFVQGSGVAKLFQANQQVTSIPSGTNVSYLLS